MARPKNCRMVSAMPGVVYFKPRGIPLTDLEEVVLSLDEFEALRLADLEGLYQVVAAERMKISRPTFGRIIESAHKKVAEALAQGKALKIEGGAYQMMGMRRRAPVKNAKRTAQSGDEEAEKKMILEKTKELEMKIALPSVNDMVDGHFGHCESFTVFTVDENNRIVNEERLVPPPGCGCKSDIVPQLSTLGVKVMLAGNMGQGAVNMLEAHGISVVRGCQGPLKKVVEAWLAGRITDSGLGCSEHGDQGCNDHS